MHELSSWISLSGSLFSQLIFSDGGEILLDKVAVCIFINLLFFFIYSACLYLKLNLKGPLN